MPFNIAIYVSLFLAIVMIVGGIWLLAKGVIKLSEAGKSEGALSVELFNKFKINTGYPALAFFIIGLFFIALAICFSKPADVVPVVFVGKLNLDDATVVRGKVVPVTEVGATFQPDSSGAIETLHPDVRFEVQMVAPGYEPELWTSDFTAEKGRTKKIDLSKDVKFIKKAGSGSPSAGNIIDLPPNANVPSVREGKGFKPSS